MYAFSVATGGVTPLRSVQMNADSGEHKSPIRPARLPETNIEHRAGVIGGLPLFLAVGAIHHLRRFTHSAQRHAMVREIEKEVLRDETGSSTPELMEKMTRLVTLEIDELHLLVEKSQKDTQKAKLEVKLLTSELQAAKEVVRNWEDRGHTEMAKTARRLFAVLGSYQTRAAKAEREVLALREEVSQLQSQRDQSRSDIIKLCAVWSVLLLALGKLIVIGNGEVGNIFYR